MLRKFLKSKILFVFLTLCSFTMSAQAVTCTGLTQVTPINLGNGTYLQLAYNSAPVTINITLTDYPSFITAALAGQPLTSSPAATIPFCIAVTKSQNTTWLTSDMVSPGQQHFLGLYGPSVTYGPNAGLTDFKLTSTSNASDTLAAHVSLCPCGYFNGTNCTGITPEAYSINTGGHPVMVNTLPFNGDELGLCEDDAIPPTGAFLIDIYAKPGEIPAVGAYTAGAATPFEFGVAQ